MNRQESLVLMDVAGTMFARQRDPQGPWQHAGSRWKIYEVERTTGGVRKIREMDLLDFTAQQVTALKLSGYTFG